MQKLQLEFVLQIFTLQTISCQDLFALIVLINIGKQAQQTHLTLLLHVLIYSNYDIHH